MPILTDLFLVLSLPPEGFPIRKAGKMGMCALYSLKALIEGYDATVQRRVYEYAQDKFSKITNFMLPFSMERVLRKYGIPYEKFSGKSHRSREAKIARLKQKLKQGPLCLLIANAYGEGAKPRWFRLLYHWHYITLRGYDDQKQIVYIYDSNTKKRNFSHMPIGNTRMTYRELIHYRSIGASWMLRWYGISVQYS